MNEKQFIEKYQADLPIYKAWGDYVKNRICNKIKDTDDIDTFLKINCEPRVKDLDSIVQKAFYRDKPYTDPYNQITDKVGLRFVVLLGSDIKKVGKIIENIEEWDARKDRDFEEERDHKPNVFDYQSVHYVVKNKKPIQQGDCEIPAGTPCEIQIRTLMQHSYSEVTHDKLYKKTHPNSKLYRNVAKCMALIEVVDDLYMEVDEIVSKKETFYKGYLDKLKSKYVTLLNSDNSENHEQNYSEKLNMYILEELDELISEIPVDDVVNSTNQYGDYINRSYLSNKLYQQPTTLLIYYIIDADRRSMFTKLKNLWPLSERQLESFSHDLSKY
ncbi:RelA/SpoT domain-containing protein [Methanococcus maripaludis X1]|jgi:ppGpp synthetase/RelA/SpoT-type nucleotidyltranferase|uniref:protein adenylyltransferase n=1 Tax=Methanococcus maripaludis X1 TaxID=1053692 RepID=G0GZN4_METMI|nr:RelA/SpoT domain-containing protein [Methanococcus maripaludis]AEK19765.1 RelA/SpoT domain-containing protein [Methanococcus maripaludis X1]